MATGEAEIEHLKLLIGSCAACSSGASPRDWTGRSSNSNCDSKSSKPTKARRQLKFRTQRSRYRNRHRAGHCSNICRATFKRICPSRARSAGLRQQDEAPGRRHCSTTRVRAGKLPRDPACATEVRLLVL